MEKGLILGWLATLHWRREQGNMIFPNMPMLAQVIEQSNSKLWSEQLYKEMDYLGRMTGLLFGDYLHAIKAPIALPGSAASNPINLPEDDDDDLDHYDPPGRAAPVRRRSVSVDGSLKSHSNPFVYFDFTDSATSDTEDSGQSGWTSNSSVSVTYVTAESSDLMGLDSATTATSISLEAPTGMGSERTTDDGQFFGAHGMDVDSEGSTVG